MQIEVANLSFKYESQISNVLTNLSFTIDKGSYVSIIGHNGSGKSTIAKLLIGLLTPKQGTIKINGVLLNEETAISIRNDVAIVFQNPDNQFIGSTVRDDIAFGLENRQIEPQAMDSIINYFANEVSMANYLDHEPTKLSGGQKQRVAIAGALALAPQILILDEASAMLDPNGKEEINQLVRKLHQKHQMTIISITHDIEEALLSDRIIVLNQGEIALDGKPADIFKSADKLLAMSLDIPFSLKLFNSLKKEGIILANHYQLEKQWEELCQLNLNK